MGSGNVSRQTTGRRKSSGQRSGARVPATLEIEVQGVTSEFSGQTVNVSCSGALIWISDERFATEDEAQNLVVYGEKVAEEFHDMRIRFTGRGVVREAEVVRVVSNTAHKGGPPMVACRFLHSLRFPEVERLGLDPAAVLPTAPVGKQSNPPPKRAKKKKAPPPEDEREERRNQDRLTRLYYAQVMGGGGTFRASVLNLSRGGALMTINDPAMPMPQTGDDLVDFTQRLSEQFANGMTMRILEGEVTLEADVVRVSERTLGDAFAILIGVQFRRSLTDEECHRLEIAPRLETRIRELMRRAMESSATDLHIKVGVPPRMRVGGTLRPAAEDVVGPDEAHDMALELMTAEQAARFEQESDVEFAYMIEDVGRFRVNILRQRGLTGLAVRCIPDRVPTLAELGLEELAPLAEKPRGIVLVTGPAGAGKSTTLAALVDHVNRTRACHVITLEDPIEFLHHDQEAHITQREIGRDARGFAPALGRALRQDPDVLMVGEMRDLETISLALTAAETGHLVFATLPARSAALAPDRIVDVFPPGQQTQIRTQLADSLQGVLAQMLVPRADRPGTVLAREVLVATDAVRALIRENKTAQLYNAMQTGVKEGMQTLETVLNGYVEQGVVSYEAAVAKAHHPKRIRRRGGSSDAR